MESLIQVWIIQAIGERLIILINEYCHLFVTLVRGLGTGQALWAKAAKL
ncbi:MAG: hypothetical protein LBJ41_02500 [Treponema sp.]|nr:hypothetical protein [Treponema sp.]